MGGSRSNSADRFARSSMDRSTKMFNTAFPLFEKGMGMATAATRTGESPFMKAALDAAQANAMDSAAIQAQAQGDAGELGEKGAIAFGNTGRALSGEDLGAKLAQFIRGSQSQRQTARISQILDAAGVGVGQVGAAGEAQTRSLSNQLAGISLMPTQDPNVSRVLAGVAAASSVYGAGRDAGWWGGTGGQIKQLPMQQTWMARPAASPPPNPYGSTVNYMPSYWGY